MIIESTWTNVACVYLLDTGMTIGDSSRLATPADLALPSILHTTMATHIEADCVQITFPSINTLRISWRRRDGDNRTPLRQGSLIYSGAFLIVEC